MRPSAVGFAVVIAAVLLLPGTVRAQGSPPGGEWLKYRDHFITRDGRVLDTGNHAHSHSEGQGWAMLFAASFGDCPAFDRIWGWTRQHLQRRDSALFSWQWDPLADNPISDTNNASDGDIMIAWALARAAGRCARPEYRREAERIVVDIRHRLVETISGQLVLLPGTEGFKEGDGTTIVNPSYYVYPAFREFGALDPSPVWTRLRQDGLALLDKARFGRWGLTPDWIELHRDGGVSPDTHRPPRFGFDAIRIPLYLIWGGAVTPDRLAADLRFWDAFPGRPIPAWTDVRDGSVAPYAVPSGFQAIIELARGLGAAKPPPLPAIADSDDYYSASLTLLAGMARRAVAR